MLVAGKIEAGDGQIFNAVKMAGEFWLAAILPEPVVMGGVLSFLLIRYYEDGAGERPPGTQFARGR